jgi:hypothetical protein
MILHEVLLECDVSSHRFFAWPHSRKLWKTELCDTMKFPKRKPHAHELAGLPPPFATRLRVGLSVEFDAGLLHFRVRQEPDK